MTKHDECRILRDAQRLGMAPYPFAVLAVLIQHSNTKWQCHPALRRIAECANIHRTKVSDHIAWLEDVAVIAIRKASRQVNHYTIQRLGLWRVSPSGCQFYNVNLSPHSDSLPVTPKVTRAFSKLQRICHPTGAVTVNTHCAADAEKSFGDTQACQKSPVDMGVYSGNGSSLRVFEG